MGGTTNFLLAVYRIFFGNQDVLRRCEMDFCVFQEGTEALNESSEACGIFDELLLRFLSNVGTLATPGQVHYGFIGTAVHMEEAAVPGKKPCMQTFGLWQKVRRLGFEPRTFVLSLCSESE